MEVCLVKNNNNNHRSEEDIAKSLRKLSSNRLNKRELLHTTLSKIPAEDHAYKSEEHILLQNSDISDNNLREAPTSTSNKSWFTSKLMLYTPLVAVVLVVMVGGIIFSRRQSATNTSVTSSVSSKSPVEVAATALIADVAQEDTINQELSQDAQMTSKEVINTAGQIGDISNDNSF